MNIKVTVRGFKELRRNMGEAGKAVYPLAKSALNKSAIQIKGRAKNNAPVAFGDLQRSFKHDVKGLTATVWSGKEYALYVEKGTRPHFPPVAPLARWAGLKLGDSSLGFVIARSIAKKGTKAQPFFEPAVEDSVGDIEKNFEVFADQLVRIMAK